MEIRIIMPLYPMEFTKKRLYRRDWQKCHWLKRNQVTHVSSRHRQWRIVYFPPYPLAEATCCIGLLQKWELQGTRTLKTLFVFLP